MTASTLSEIIKILSSAQALSDCLYKYRGQISMTQISQTYKGQNPC
jgi:hypothetical protein